MHCILDLGIAFTLEYTYKFNEMLSPVSIYRTAAQEPNPITWFMAAGHCPASVNWLLTICRMCQ